MALKLVQENVGSQAGYRTVNGACFLAMCARSFSTLCLYLTGNPALVATTPALLRFSTSASEYGRKRRSFTTSPDASSLAFGTDITYPTRRPEA